MEGKEVQGLAKKEIIKDLEVSKRKERIEEEKTPKESETTKMKAKTEKELEVFIVKKEESTSESGIKLEKLKLPP